MSLEGTGVGTCYDCGGGIYPPGSSYMGLCRKCIAAEVAYEAREDADNDARSDEENPA